MASKNQYFNGARYFCRNCGKYSNKATLERGGALLKFLLYLMFFLPGYLFSKWQRAGKKSCPSCKHSSFLMHATGEGQVSALENNLDEYNDYGVNKTVEHRKALIGLIFVAIFVGLYIFSLATEQS